MSKTIRFGAWAGGVGLALLGAAACAGSGVEATSGSLAFVTDSGPVETLPTFLPHVWCGDWQEGGDDAPAVHVWLNEMLLDDYEMASEFDGWSVRAKLADLPVGEPIPLSIDADDEAVTVFAVEETREFSSTALGSSGSITFDAVECNSETPQVAFTVNAVLAGETDDSTATFSGDFSGSVNEPPNRDPLYWLKG
jgi:hypothetical protein